MMSITRKQLFIAAGAVGVAIILGTLAYSFLSRNEGPQGSDPGFFPTGDGRTVGEADGEPQGSKDEAEGAGKAADQYLFQLHDKPIVSSTIFARTKKQFIRFMEEGTGHVYEYDIADKKSYRISNTSVPKIQEALWSEDGNIVAFRYEDGGVLKAATAELSTSTAESAFRKVNFLPSGIKSLALSPDGTRVFYLIAGTAQGISQGVIANRDGSSPRAIFTSKLPRWFASWPSQNSILVSSPWASDGGLVYRINPQNGALAVAFSTQGSFVGANGGPRGELVVSDPRNGFIAIVGVSGSLTPRLPLSWPSLCSFSSQATGTAACAAIPEAGVSLFAEWARGEHDFQSELTIVNFVTGEVQYLLGKEAEDRVFDIVSLALSPDASYATFKNRVDGMLWGVRTK